MRLVDGPLRIPDQSRRFNRRCQIEADPVGLLAAATPAA